MASTEETGLIVYKTTSTSVFGRFISALMEEHGQQQRIAISSMLIAFPILEAVAAGLAIVCQKVAAKLQISLTTESGWRDVSDRINRVISLALMVEYETPENAAKAFSEAVVLPILHAQRPREVQGLYQLFFNSSAQFFADRMSNATRIRRELESLYAAFEKGNDFGNLSVLDDTHVEDTLGIVSYLNPAERMETEEAGWQVRRIQELITEVPRHLVTQQALRSLPLHFNRIPEEAIGEYRSIQPAWINTQLLLAALEAPSDDGHLQADDYSTAVARLHAASNDEMIKHFSERMRARGFKGLPSAQEEALKSVLVEQLERLRFPSNAQLGNDGIEKSFVDMSSAKKVHFSHNQALGFLKGDPLEEALNRHPPTREQLLSAVDWRKVTARDIKEMFKFAAVEVEVVARGITLMQAKYHAAAVKQFLENDDLTKDYRRILMDAGILPVTLELVTKNRGFFTLDEIATGLPGLLKELRTVHSDESCRDLAATLIELGKRLGHTAEDPNNRWAFVDGMMNRALQAPSERVNGKKVRPCFAPEIWERLCLATLVQECAPESLKGGKCYSGLNDEELFEDFPPWEQRFDAKGSGVPRWRLWSDLSHEDGARLVAKYSEEEIFRWLYEYRGDKIDRLWATYAKARDAFYSHWSKQKG